MNKTVNVRITTELKNPAEAGTHHRLLCMTGSNKGKVYYLLGKRIIIGRGETADIQIVDTKISREHAELSFADNGYTITDLGAQNGVIVNDSKVKQKKLADTEKIVIGQTVFKYNLIEVTNTEMVIAEEGASALTKESAKTAAKARSKTVKVREDEGVQFQREAKTEKKGGRGLIMILAVVGLAYFFLFDTKEAPVAHHEKKDGVRNAFDEPLPKNNKDTGDDPDVKKKIEHYIHSGRREFTEGNYFRAMEDFRLALLLSPNNGDASYYLSKAKQSLDDDIQRNFLKGKQEYESKKLQAAIVSYCGVVQLIQNYPTDERYKNAMAKISAIESELGMEKGEVKCFEAKSADTKN